MVAKGIKLPIKSTLLHHDHYWASGIGLTVRQGKRRSALLDIAV